MSFSSQLLLGSILVAVASFLVAQRSDPLPSLPAMGRALFALFWFSVLALVVHAIVSDLDFFGVTHIVYLAVVVSIPLTSFLLLGTGWARLRGTKRRLANLNYILLAIGILPAGIGWYATHVEPDRLVTDSQTIVLGDTTGPIRVAVIADLQSPNVGDHEWAAINRAIESEPDLVVLPGDLWAASPQRFRELRPDLVELLGALIDTTHHVVMVVGDTDNLPGLQGLADETGVVLLANEIWEHDVAGQDIVIAGTTLPVGERSSIDESLLAELRSVPDDQLTIMVSHRPDAVLGLDESTPVDLVIAGHTHGGQVAVPGLGPLVTFSDVPRSAAGGGASIVNGRALYVSAGVGLERNQAPQIRFGVPPEVGILDLVPS